MLSRRHIRIKVLQVLYAYYQENNPPFNRYERLLIKSLREPYEALVATLYILCQTIDYVNVVAEIKASKFLPTEEDKKFSTIINQNFIFRLLKNSRQFARMIRKTKIDKRNHEDLIRQLYLTFSRTDTYQQYSQTAQHTLESERNIIRFLLHEIILTDDLFHEFMEDIFPHWQDDIEGIIHEIEEFINTAEPDKQPDLPFEPSDEIFTFANSLFRKTIKYHDSLIELISPKLVKWDENRIAMLDRLMIEMALCELLYFPDIPVKVSINEYIEIAKMYSTDKSKDFINGILDSLLKDLRNENKIVKYGRGLIE